jgi:hypothetical protein
LWLKPKKFGLKRQKSDATDRTADAFTLPFGGRQGISTQITFDRENHAGQVLMGDNRSLPVVAVVVWFLAP